MGNGACGVKQNQGGKDDEYEQQNQRPGQPTDTSGQQIARHSLPFT